MSIHLNKQFLRAIDNNPRNCILFVGAGLSSSHVRRNNKGLPTWYYLIESMIEELKDAQKCNQSTLNKLTDLFNKKCYLKVAQIFKENTRADQYAAFLKEQLDPSDLKKSNIHKLILSINFRGIITTNFDCVFENQTNRIQPLIYPQGFEDIRAFRSDGFYAKIHGCIRNTPNLYENLVLSEESYRYLRKNERYQTILRSLFLLHPILTVGFSLNDPDFLGLIDDIKEIFGDSMPTIYSLMSIDDEFIRNEWRKQGIEIIAYEKHSELLEFFNKLKKFSDSKNRLTNIKTMEKESEIDYDKYRIYNHDISDIEKFEDLINRQLKKFKTIEEKETFLIRLKAIMNSDDNFFLTPYLCTLNTVTSKRILFTIFKEFSDLEGYSRIHYAYPIRKNLLNVHKWLLRNFCQLVRETQKEYSIGINLENHFEWLLHSQWEEFGIDNLKTFNTIYDSIIKHNIIWKLDSLYKASMKIEGASKKIEQIVFSEQYIREDDNNIPRFKWWCEQAKQDIRFIKFENQIKNDDFNNYKIHLEEAFKYDDDRLHELVLNRIFDNYTQLTCLSLHGSNSNYNPSESRKILNALAEISISKLQIDVLRAIEKYVEDERNRGRIYEIDINLKNELLYPLYWRYSNETRREFTIHSYMRRFHKGSILHSGQNFLLNKFLGLTYDIDKDFVDEFNKSLSKYKKNNIEEYEPRPLQELWSYRELKYVLSEDIPPELIRQFAVFRVEWDYMEESEIRWNEAKNIAEKSFHKETFNRYFSKKENNFILDNLLGNYSPRTFTITLFPKIIDMIANELDVDSQSLGTVAYIHLTIHAFCHIAKDLNGWDWTDFSLLEPNQPVLKFNKTLEAIAQYYTYKLIEHLQDKKLKKAFTEFENHSVDVYKEWRKIENYSLEDVRAIIIKYRKMANDLKSSFEI